MKITENCLIILNILYFYFMLMVSTIQSTSWQQHDYPVQHDHPVHWQGGTINRDVFKLKLKKWVVRYFFGSCVLFSLSLCLYNPIHRLSFLVDFMQITESISVSSLNFYFNFLSAAKHTMYIK